MRANHKKSLKLIKGKAPTSVARESYGSATPRVMKNGIFFLLLVSESES